MTEYSADPIQYLLDTVAKLQAEVAQMRTEVHARRLSQMPHAAVVAQLRRDLERLTKWEA